jgi:hypothetical protein
LGAASVIAQQTVKAACRSEVMRRTDRLGVHGLNTVVKMSDKVFVRIKNVVADHAVSLLVGGRRLRRSSRALRRRRIGTRRYSRRVSEILSRLSIHSKIPSQHHQPFIH